MSSHQRTTSDMPSQWPIPDGPLIARSCVLAGWRPYDSRAIKRRQYFISKYGYFHCCYRCCYMYIMDINKFSFPFWVLTVTSAKQWRSMKASKLFQKYPKTPYFDHSNYQLFERIPAVPGTSINQGLTVQVSTFCQNIFQILSDSKMDLFTFRICMYGNSHK